MYGCMRVCNYVHASIYVCIMVYGRAHASNFTVEFKESLDVTEKRRHY